MAGGGSKKTMVVNLNRIAEAIDNYGYAKVTPLNEDFFKWRLEFFIPTTPITDSRPRTKKDVLLFYNMHKELLKKLFRPLYRMDDKLNSITIRTMTRINLTAYLKPSKVFLSLAEKDFEFEGKYSLYDKDNDNLEKVHWDVFQDDEFCIIIDDRLVVENHTKKLMSNNEGVLVQIDFATDESQRGVTKGYSEMIETLVTFKKSYLVEAFTSKHVDPEDLSLWLAYNLLKSGFTERQVGNVLNDYKIKELLDLMRVVKPECTKIKRDDVVAVLKQVFSSKKTAKGYLNMLLKKYEKRLNKMSRYYGL